MDTRSAPWAATLLRVATAILFFAHFGLKYFVFTPAGAAKFFASLGLPADFAYVTMAWELIGGVLLLIGFMPRLVALLMTPILLGAIITVHGPAGFYFTNPNGGWEFIALWIIALLSITLIGDGKLAVKKTPILSRD